MKRSTIYRVAVVVIFAMAAPVLAEQAHHGEQVQQAAHETEKFVFTAEFIKTALLFSLWLTVAAIVIGPLVYWFVGDLWQRKNGQPFTDDEGVGHGGHAQAAAAHH